MKVYFEVTLPLPVYKTKGTYKLLGMNTYRNLHYQVLNKAKQEYKTIVYSAVQEYVKKQVLRQGITVEYILFFARKNRKDLTNFAAVVDKFFLDALVDIGIIKDDRIPYVVKTKNIFGGWGKDKVKIRVLRE